MVIWKFKNDPKSDKITGDRFKLCSHFLQSMLVLCGNVIEHRFAVSDFTLTPWLWSITILKTKIVRKNHTTTPIFSDCS